VTTAARASPYREPAAHYITCGKGTIVSPCHFAAFLCATDPCQLDGQNLGGLHCAAKVLVTTASRTSPYREPAAHCITCGKGDRITMLLYGISGAKSLGGLHCAAKVLVATASRTSPYREPAAVDTPNGILAILTQ